MESIKSEIDFQILSISEGFDGGGFFGVFLEIFFSCGVCLACSCWRDCFLCSNWDFVVESNSPETYSE